MTRRILRFLGLKVAEVGIVLALPFGIGKMSFLFPAFSKWLEIERAGFWSVWTVGLFSLLLLVAAGLVIFLLAIFIQLNWEWAK